MRNIKYTLIFCLFNFALRAQDANLLDIKIGQMILIGFPKAEVDAQVLEEIRTGKVGSIILFEKNVPKSTASFTALKKMIWTYKKAAQFPLLVAIDQEGGRVNRLKDKYGFARSITAQAMGRAGTLDSVKFYAESTAATLAGLGFNFNFAPVVDLAVNKENPVIYKAGRSFGANPDSVVLMAEEFIKAHRRFGVLTSLKHFPGHGSSMADTHFGIADVSNTWSPIELSPYAELMNRGEVDAILTSHIVNFKLDPRGYPGTLSSRMIDSLLRKQMHYDGVVITDDMHMEAITKHYGLDSAIMLAINAGVDILCFSSNIPGSEERTAGKVHSIIRSFVDRGVIKPERIDESFNRILKLKYRAGQTSEEYLTHQLEDARKELAALKKPDGTKPEVKEVKSDASPEEPQPEEDNGKKKKKKKS